MIARIALILTLACWPLAAQIAVIGEESVAKSSACATTDTTWAHDVFLEGFTSPLENTPAAETGSGVLTPGYDTSALSTGKIAGQCNTALLVDTTDTDGTEHRYRWDLAEAIDLDTTPVTIRFRIYIVTALPATAQALTILAVTSTTTVSTSNIGGVGLYFNGTNMQARVSGTYVTIPTGEWTTCVWYIDSSTTGNLSSFQIGANTPQYFNRGANDLQYIHAGAVLGLDADEDCEFILDLLAID